VAFTYELSDLAAGASTAAGRLATVRLLLTDCVDTDDQPAIFQDEEIVAFLALADEDVHEAAALGYENWARSRGRIAKMLKTSTITSERHAIETLMGAAQKIRDAALRGTLKTGEIATSSQHYLAEFRPDWRGFDDVPVVE